MPLMLCQPANVLTKARGKRWSDLVDHLSTVQVDPSVHSTMQNSTRAITPFGSISILNAGLDRPKPPPTVTIFALNARVTLHKSPNTKPKPKPWGGSCACFGGVFAQ